MGEGLLRQRRNLLIVCLLLWFSKYAGVDISKASIAGFDVQIKNMEALFTTLWIAFSYFLYRYYQYFASEGVKQLVVTATNALNDKCRPYIQGIVKAAHGDAGGGSDLSWSFLRLKNWTYPGYRETVDTLGQPIGENFEIPISPWKLKWAIASAILDTFFRNSVVTDYLLPFFVAGWVLWYSGDPNWKGSFLHLLV